MRAFTLGIYAVFGALSLVAATAALLAPQLVLADDFSPLTAHLIREEAAAFVFIGLMFFWCLRHFDQRRPVHLALMVFTGLFAVIHWADYLREYRHIEGALVNTVPVLVLTVTAPFGRRDARVASSGVTARQ
jgi:hypothetical protein